MSIFGGMSAASANAQAAQQSRVYASQEYNVENQELQQRKQAMELSNQRSQLENLRNAQRARAVATQAGVNQGAQFGSGIQGGLAQISNEAGFNEQGLSNSLQTGENLFGLNSQLNTLRYNQSLNASQSQSAQSTYQGWQSLGGSLMKAGPLLGPLTKGFSFGGGNSSGG